jgi:acyl-coenzyme A thioesterase PaaI-like protein
MNDDLLDSSNAFLKRSAPRVHETGLRFTKLQPGDVEARIPFEGNGNHFGVVYAGFIFMVAEILGGAIHAATFDARTHYPLVKSLTIDFVSPARGALISHAELSPEEVSRIRAGLDGGKVEFELSTTVTAEEGRALVATSRGTYQLRPVGT